MDARIQRSRAAVLSAATDLWIEGGIAAVTVDAIVERSGVAKSTVYRHWSSRDELVVDVIRTMMPSVDVPDRQVPFEEALRSVLADFVEVFRNPQWAHILPSLMMLRFHEPSIYALESEMRSEQLSMLENILQRGVSAGRLRADVHVGRSAAYLIGPLLFAHFHDDIELDREFSDEIVDRFIAAHQQEHDA